MLGAPHISILVTDSVKLTLGGGLVMAVGTNFLHQNLVFHSPFPLIAGIIGPIASIELRDDENKLLVPFPKTDCFKQSLAYSGAVLWNNFPHRERKAKFFNTID